MRLLAGWLVVDGTEVLAGERGADGEVVAIRTRQPLLVKLLSWYIWHSIALATLLNDLNDHLKVPWIRRPAHLQAVGPSEQHGGWLEYMHHLIGITRLKLTLMYYSRCDTSTSARRAAVSAAIRLRIADTERPADHA